MREQVNVTLKCKGLKIISAADSDSSGLLSSSWLHRSVGSAGSIRYFNSLWIVGVEDALPRLVPGEPETFFPRCVLARHR
ncbi:hypothetical protein EPR50_G00140240 [Perca flavescens]|uniref:Uncharacterized protein n=1 Tax=Perca flavescens TaxID=8167 RepID=A0A484CMZ0_PERFV|nr:hypothetical protein EPR50_G00140240 [Perca flavescens]